MDIASLIPMVGDGPNRSLVESIGASYSILDDLELNFHPSLGDQGEKEVTCFYETEQSPTARQVSLLIRTRCRVQRLIAYLNRMKRVDGA